MKMYHELAQVKDGNKRVGWLVTAHSDLKGAMFYHLEYLSEEDFISCVSRGLVQYFTIKNGRLAIEYTSEELTAMRKAGVKKVPTSDLREYLSLDVSLQRKPLFEALNGGKPYVYGISARKLYGRIFCQVWVFSGTPAVAGRLFQDLNLLNEADNSVFAQSIIKGSVKMGADCIYGMPTIRLMELWKKYGMANISMKSAKTALRTAKKYAEGNARKTRRVNKLYAGEELEEIIRKVETV